MLTCISCSKQTTEEDEGGARGSATTPSTKEAVKSLTAQIKDMALKVSGAYRQSKPSDCRSKEHRRSYPDFDTISEGVPYPQTGSSSSTPAWDFTGGNHHRPSRFAGDRSPGGQSSCDVNVLIEDNDEGPKEWMAQVEPGVHITFASLPTGGNDLKRIRFSREMFNKWQAQRWWGENFDRIMELYNVQRFNRQALQTPSRSEDERESSYSRLGSARESPMTSQSLNREWPSTSRNYYPYGAAAGACSVEASRTTTSSRDEASASISNASELGEAEWVEQDEPGVYITIRQLGDGARELRRVRFSRERFGEVHAKLWWDQNRERIQAQYL